MSDYIAAAMVACPRCRASVGAPCKVRACRNGYADCMYKACSYFKELPEPHLERSVAARQAQQTPSALRIDAAAGGDGAPVGCLPPDPRPAAPERTQR